MKTFLKCMYEAARKNNKLAYYFNRYNAIVRDIEPLLNEAAVIYTEQSNSHKHGVMQGLPYYQLCPKCFGEGYVPSIGTTSSLHRICPVCNGAKTIYHALSGSPTVGRAGGQSSD